MLYALRRNAGYICGAQIRDRDGWQYADFVFSVRENGTVKLFKNRKDNLEIEFLNVDNFYNYVQDFYDIDVRDVYYIDLGFDGWQERAKQITKYIAKMNG